MTEIQVHRAPLPADQYMIVTNDFMRGQLPVPLKALPRVLLGYLLSLPSGWRVTRDRLDDSVEEGRDAVDKALRDLEAAGYLVRTRRRAQGGVWEWTYAVTDDPKTRPITGSTIPGKSGDGVTRENTTNAQVAPSPGKPSTENQGIETEDLPQKTEVEDLRDPAAIASEPALDLPGVEDELARKRREQVEGKPPTLNQRATRLAQAHYERLGKMGNVPAMMKIIRKALEHGYDDAVVDRTCAWIADRRWTLTEERLANALRGGPQPAGRTAPASPPRPVVRTGRNGTGPVLEGYEG
jgi:hypothetical protein